MDAVMADAQTTERRPHTKSRRGCLSCKKRHVKCNEVHPKCSRCLRLGVRCVWPAASNNNNNNNNNASTASDSRHVSVPAAVPIPVARDIPTPATDHFQSPPPLSSIPELGVQDLKLLHFWMQNTSGTCTFGGNQFLWQTTLPELGFRHPFLLRGILAVTAVHKAVVYPEESAELQRQSSVHMEAALAVFREHLKYSDIAMAVPIFAMSSLLSMHSTGVALLSPPLDPIGTLVVWMRLTRGVRTACQEHWSRITSSELAVIVTSTRRSEERKDSEVDIIHLGELIRLHVAPEDPSLESYMTAVDELHMIASNVRYPLDIDQLPVNITMSWPARLSYHMLDLIEQKDPIAMAIMGHFAVLLSLLEDRSWYLRHWGKWVLEGAEAVVAGTEYDAWLEWPRTMLRKDSPVH